MNKYIKECLFPQSLKNIYKNYDDYTYSIDKIISYGKHLYKAMNKEAIYNIKKEYESENNINLEQLTKKYDMTLLRKTKTFSSSQSSTDFSLSKNNDNNNHVDINKQICSSGIKSENNINIIDEEEGNFDECGSEEEMNTTNLHLHVFDTKKLELSPLKPKKDNND